MRLLKQIFAFYVNANLHLALAVLCLVHVTALKYSYDVNDFMSVFVFFGSITGYIFIKLGGRIIFRKWNGDKTLIGFAVLGLISMVICVFCFFNLEEATNIPGLKIYLVGFCWAGITVLLPVVNTHAPFSMALQLQMIQRFVLVLVMLLAFEIVDLKKDDLKLKTVPQLIGVQRTKWLGYLLILLYLGISFIKYNRFLPDEIVIAVLLAVLLFFSNDNRSRYYASFLVESIPIVWWFLLICGI
jgi:hypothetical protein